MSSLAPKIVVGLGNPGDRYAATRHNAGFMVVDTLAGECATGAWRRECRSMVCQAVVGRTRIMLAKPLTFMNLSGEAVQRLIEKKELVVADVILVVDDFNLPFGRVRIRTTGAAGGHNGLESVIRTLGTKELTRIRLGIGEDGMPEDKAEFVLADFPHKRAAELKEMIIRAGDAVKAILSDGVSKAMSLFNA